jgi:hypothetical protein
MSEYNSTYDGEAAGGGVQTGDILRGMWIEGNDDIAGDDVVNSSSSSSSSNNNSSSSRITVSSSDSGGGIYVDFEDLSMSEIQQVIYDSAHSVATHSTPVAAAAVSAKSGGSLPDCNSNSDSNSLDGMTTGAVISNSNKS